MFSLGYTFGMCDNYIQDGKRKVATAVVGPHKIKESHNENGATGYDIIVGCNLSLSCQNESCFYSKVSRDRRREERLARG